MASRKENQQRATEIESIFQRFFAQLDSLKKQQTERMNKFIRELEQRKIEEIRRGWKE